MVIAPGAYDGITARLIAQAGFPAVYMTGAGFYATNVMVLFPLLPRTSPSSHDQAFDCLGFSSGRFQFHAVP